MIVITLVVAIAILVILGCLSFGPERKWFLLLGLWSLVIVMKTTGSMVLSGDEEDSAGY